VLGHEEKGIRRLENRSKHLDKRGKKPLLLYKEYVRPQEKEMILRKTAICGAKTKQPIRHGGGTENAQK